MEWNIVFSFYFTTTGLIILFNLSMVVITKAYEYKPAFFDLGFLWILIVAGMFMGIEELFMKLGRLEKSAGWRNLSRTCHVRGIQTIVASLLFTLVEILTAASYWSFAVLLSMDLFIMLALVFINNRILDAQPKPDQTIRLNS